MHRTLYLSHWDAETPVFISPAIFKDLTNYQIMAVRYLYRCYSKEQKGAILNEEEDMNFQIQILTLLSALSTFVTTDSPVIVVCDKESLLIWHYYLSTYTSTEVTVIKEQSTCTEYSKIILCSVDNVKWLKRTDLTFFMVVIDDLDLNLNRKLVKQLKGQFHIGLTKRNFLNYPDPKLFRNMLLWAVPGVVGKLEEFIKEDENHLYNLRDAYREWWLRLTWSFCDTFEKPSQQEKLKIKSSIKNWDRDHNILAKEKQVNVKAPRGRKRKSKEVSPSKKTPEKIETDVPTKTEPTSFQELRGRKRKSKEVSPSKESPEKIETDNIRDIPTKTEPTSSQETIICEQEDYQTNEDFSILTSIINNDVKASFDEKKVNIISKDEVLSMLLEEPKMENEDSNILSLSIVKDEDDVESRNRDVLSLLYGDGD